MAELPEREMGREDSGGYENGGGGDELHSVGEREGRGESCMEGGGAEGRGRVRGDAWRRPGRRGRRQPGRRWLGRVCARGEHTLCLLAGEEDDREAAVVGWAGHLGRLVSRGTISLSLFLFSFI